MYLNAITKRNPALIQAAVELHQSGAIPPNTYLIDLDAIRSNAKAHAMEAERVGVTLYFMSKHFNRNPLVAHAIVSQGIAKAVAVDIQCAKLLHYYGVPVGHVGHLVQTPKHAIGDVLDMRPDVMTVFSVEKARQISEAAVLKGMVQDIILRIRSEEDIIYPNEEGGIWQYELPKAAEQLRELKGIRVAGVTTFPATLFNPKTKRLEPTINFKQMHKSKDILAGLGFEMIQINAPGASSIRGLQTVADHGGTHAEPGHALTGSTPAVLYDELSPEIPAMIYVSEVSHMFEDKAYVMGGGFYACDTPADRGDDSAYHTDPWSPHAYVGRTAKAILDQKVPVDILSFFGRTQNATDYYGGTLVPKGPTDIQVGDTAVYGFRAQAFTMRSHVAVVEGLQTAPRLLGVFDRANQLLDEHGYPYEDSKARIQKLIEYVKSR
jgi:predicted amino acid racemase